MILGFKMQINQAYHILKYFPFILKRPVYIIDVRKLRVMDKIVLLKSTGNVIVVYDPNNYKQTFFLTENSAHFSKKIYAIHMQYSSTVIRFSIAWLHLCASFIVGKRLSFLVEGSETILAYKRCRVLVDPL